MAGVLQAFVGFLMTSDLFILMMQSTNVIGMCLNFAALYFVQDIDDLAFQVASDGWLGPKIQSECLGVGDVLISVKLKNQTSWMRRGGMIVMALALYVSYFTIVGLQFTGHYRYEGMPRWRWSDAELGTNAFSLVCTKMLGSLYSIRRHLLSRAGLL